jgi:hypothetical protein
MVNEQVVLMSFCPVPSVAPSIPYPRGQGQGQAQAQGLGEEDNLVNNLAIKKKWISLSLSPCLPPSLQY